MIYPTRVVALLLLVVQLSTFAFGHGTKEDYQRMAAQLGKLYGNKVFRTNIQPALAAGWPAPVVSRAERPPRAYKFVLVDLRSKSLERLRSTMPLWPKQLSKAYGKGSI